MEREGAVAGPGAGRAGFDHLPRALRSVQRAKEDFVARYERDYPSATACFLDDFEACIAHLQLPIVHRRTTRTTNLLERLFAEERRRTKVIPHAFGERAVLKLMYAALIGASQTWKRVVISEFELRQLEQLRGI
jgi:putative transposase